jgi:hypothetical protein
MNQLTRLRNWYAAQCDGDWEHFYGINIDTLDNPGWSLSIDLSDTYLSGKSFTTAHRGGSEEDVDWFHLKIEAGKFEAAGRVRSSGDAGSFWFLRTTDA